MEIIKHFLTKNPCYSAGKKIKIGGLMLHSVGCPQPSAETFIRNWDSADYGRACVHAFIDGNSGKVYQTLPWDYRAWHCGGSGNNTYIGVEMCEPSCIKYTGGTAFTCSDMDSAKALVKRTYDTAVELFAYLCAQYGLDPLADGVIVSHREGHTRGIASGHGDPEHLWEQTQSGCTMDIFRHAVNASMVNKKVCAETGEDQAAPEAGGASASGKQECGFEDSPIQAGDTVSLVSDSVYYDGRPMPSWVINDLWTVKSVAGDRAVIDKNTAGTSSICSPVNVRYLTAVSPATVTRESGKKAEADVPKPHINEAKPAKEGAQTERKISPRGVELISKFEGCRLSAYKCPAGVWTIGYGHTAGVKQGDTLSSPEEARNLLAKDLEKYAGYVNDCIRKGLISFRPNQNQFDALTSFAYNCGHGTLQKLVTGRDAATIAEKLLLYNKGGGRVLEGLTRRRKEERILFLSEKGEENA